MREAAEFIWCALRAAGMTDSAAAAMLGNMQAESALRADNAQDGMTRLTDKDYTAAADRGEIAFAADSVGYGLCQWTYPTRKAALLRFARAAGKSVGDMEMQVDFCIKELREDYGALWSFLCCTGDMDAAAGRICRDYERPAVDNSAERAVYARKWYETFCHCKEANNGAPAKGLTFCGERKKETEDMELDPTGASGMYQASSDYWPPRTIALGMEGPDVLLWQALLWARGYDCPTSGSFDEQTEDMTREYQRSAGLAADGIPGPLTWREGLSA